MKKIRVLFFVAGIALFAALIYKIGARQILSDISLVGYRIIYPVIIIGITVLPSTYAWWLFLRHTNHEISFWTLLRIKIQGDTTNTLTPLGFVSGDPMRVYLMSKHIRATDAGGAVIIDRFLTTLAVLVLLTLGAIIGMIALPLDWGIRIPLILIVLLMNVGLGLLIFMQKRGLSKLWAFLARKLRFKKDFAEKTWGRIARLDDAVHTCYRENRGVFLEAFLLHFSTRLVGVVEVYVIGQLLNTPLSWTAALFLTSLIPLVNMVFAIIPGSIGALEGMTAFIFYLIHLAPADGLALQIIRRLRSLIWTVIGLFMILTHRHPEKKPVPVTPS